ncbi:alpha-galactosidase [Kineosporia sp. NBRC 101731]|uniref:alpha-galactosidase n=1 Tax=Kineosporia sp. NBRC 101731 TaxID=3032199 RepID=UPI0024A07608|nr:alpha-galactosidase [Kineosporia sp. NBRC 101731]GLY29039.1 alpha-glucosidase/alpha-galactosidase [Kineosporia sp. NBRC 101731]
MSHEKPEPVVCFVGAGSVEFTRQLLRDLLSEPELAGCRIVLHDIDQRRLDLAEKIAHVTIRHHGARATVTATTDRRRALAGADFVINVVNIGGHAATLTDFDVPETFGIRQTIGDTLGVGGIFRGLRTFPFLAALAQDMLDVCPQAWLLNYTNPMAMNIAYLNAVAPGLKVLGLCHSVYWTIHDLSALVGAPLDEVTFRSAGVNHQAWVLEWQHNGEDLYPRLDALIANDEQLRRRVRVDMYRRLGFYPTETSEHSCEYVPWYLHDEAEIERLRIPLRDYVGISAGNAAQVAQLEASIDAGEYTEPEEEAAEYAPQVIHSIVTGRPRVIQVNTVNTGLITNLPAGAPVEVPCVIDAQGARPLYVGELPPQCAALNRSVLNVADLTVRAAVEGRRDHVVQALMCDPATSAQLPVGRIADLAEAMFAAHADLLPASLQA